MKNRKIWILFFCILLFECKNRNFFAPKERTGFLMDTLVRVSVWDGSLPESKLNSVLDRCFEEMEKLEQRLSVHIDTSEVSRIAQSAGEKPVSVSQTVFELFPFIDHIWQVSDGAFDVTIGSLKSLWGFESDTSPHIPTPDSILVCLKTVGFNKVKYSHSQVYLSQPGMKLDFGGIAKGYIVDQGVKVLRDGGIKAGIVEAGGDLFVFGRRPGKKHWRIGVRHPRYHETKKEVIGFIETKGDVGIATSGDYERYFIHQGKRYHHILDPKTGYPASGCISVTILAKDAMHADAWATAVFVLGPEKGMKLIEQLPEIEGLIIYSQNGEIVSRISSGLRKHYYPLE